MTLITEITDPKYKAALSIFTQRRYGEALAAFRVIEPEIDGSKKVALACRKNILVCLAEVAEKGTPKERADAEMEFPEDLEKYFQTLERVPRSEIARHETVACFAQALRVLRSVADPAVLGEKVCLVFQRFEGSFPARQEYLQEWIGQVFEERRNVFRPGYFLRAKALCGGLIRVLPSGNAETAGLRSEVLALQADLTYFDEQLAVPDQERLAQVVELLRAALEANPSNQFAGKFLEHVERFRSTLQQIRRFQHDTNARRGRIQQDLHEIRRLAGGMPELLARVEHLKREMENLLASGTLVTSRHAREEDWVSCDPMAIVRERLREAGLPEDSCVAKGVPAQVKLCRTYLAIALDRLFDNLHDAYTRRGIPGEGHRVEVVCDYDMGEIRIRDWAGGINPALGDIFEPYRSSKGVSDSVGLGLTQARDALLIQYGDLVLAEPQPTDGACFIIRLQKGDF